MAETGGEPTAYSSRGLFDASRHFSPNVRSGSVVSLFTKSRNSGNVETNAYSVAHVRPRLC
jgi:hypothetical protein